MAGCVMASRGFSPWLVLPQEQGSGRLLKEQLSFVPSHGTNLETVKSSSVNLMMQQKEDLWKAMSMLLDTKPIMQMNTYPRWPLLVDLQAESHSDSVLFSFQIADQCRRHEKILRCIVSGSSEVEGGGEIDFSTVLDLVGPQAFAIGMPQRSSSSYLVEPLPSLIIPPSDVVRLLGQLSPCGPNCVEMNCILSIISEHYRVKNLNSINSQKQPMLVPYFDRKITREVKAKSSALKLETVKAASLTSAERLKERRSQKKKINKKQIKERDLYRNSNLHACESLLSIMVVDKRREGKTAINSLKKCGGELPRLLTHISAVVAGTALAVLFSVICKLPACRRVAFLATEILNAGIGLALVRLSWGINSLRDTVISIGKSSGKMVGREEEMMDELDKVVKEIYFRAATLMAVAVVRFV